MVLAALDMAVMVAMVAATMQGVVVLPPGGESGMIHGAGLDLELRVQL